MTRDEAEPHGSLKTTGRAITLADVPPEVLKASSGPQSVRGLARPGAGNGAGADAIGSDDEGPEPFTRADELAAVMIKQGESFWSAV